ncbi:mannonate dehydratase [Muricauda sp. MAR_2010_75]|jgi:mannonate dehydratase|uniref:mannonate dehydratase n=1 Tax=Allomuricauda sp. MAR_2010_75 TaxID=1250232 RepID=UPI0005608812|nr:mannonate dehydratase [Muricauda sp. MAR_2010_75]
MKKNRRSFIKKSASMAAMASLGGIAYARSGHQAQKNIKQTAELNGLSKDAGIEMSNAYFWGMEAHAYLIELAKQMGAYGAVAGIDGRLFRNPNGKPWEYESIKDVVDAWKSVGLKYNVVEGPPSLGNKTKLGLEGKDEEIENFITFMKNVKKAGVDVICYNWMPVISWARTDMARLGRGGALMTAFDYDAVKDKPLTEYGEFTKETLWDNLGYFLRAVVPEAEQIGMKLALHPDDPQVHSIQGIPRIMNTVENFDRMLDIIASDYNGITMCQGNFSLMGPDIPTLIRRWGNAGKIHFVHFRNVRELSGELPSTKFTETFHDEGDIDMYEAMRAYYDIGFKGAMRADHVPTMAGEENKRPGYMDLGNLFAIGYMRGLAESVSKEKREVG